MKLMDPGIGFLLSNLGTAASLICPLTGLETTGDYELVYYATFHSHVTVFRPTRNCHELG